MQKKKKIMMGLISIGLVIAFILSIQKIRIYWNLQLLCRAKKPGEGEKAFKALIKIGKPAVIPCLNAYLSNPHDRGEAAIPQLLKKMGKEAEKILIKEHSKQKNARKQFLVSKLLFIDFKNFSFRNILIQDFIRLKEVSPGYAELEGSSTLKDLAALLNKNIVAMTLNNTNPEKVLKIIKTWSKEWVKNQKKKHRLQESQEKSKKSKNNNSQQKKK